MENNQSCGRANTNPKCVIFSPDENNESVYSSSVPNYDVFLSHRGKDVKETVASLIFHNLENKGFNVFLDKNPIQVGSSIPESTEDAISTASVHVVILSPNYAESTWCLRELNLIFQTGAPILPVFCGVERSELRMKDEDGVYSRALEKHKHSGNFEAHTIEEWRKGVYGISYIKGYIFTGDQGELQEQIATSVAELIYRGNSQPKRDTKNIYRNSPKI